ncbi:uncharacterized protein [Venturia canescens]|uniref:uncharacterized protein n=1 Tax=Venturia canescens TaxID=32260 RepID=UPI001C9C8F87|nr:uncharacterized protein LOC122419266 [Venturia canescens]
MPKKHAGKMSIMTENNVYECPSEERGSSDKLCFRVYENSGQFIYMPKMDDDCMEMESNIEEQIGPEKSGAIVEHIPNYHEAQHSLIYRGDQIDEFQESKLCHDSFTSLVPSDLKMEDQWEEHNSYDSSAMDDNSFEEKHFSESHYDEDDLVTGASIGADNDDTENLDDSDEETIATFLTAAGQRLALYAVEDSDQVFAVAVYDESGAPPTNFQFLVKSDVERLIGEGAVKTVKKPTQMKKQLLTNESPLQARPPLHYTDQPSENIRLRSDHQHEYDNKQSKELLMAISIVDEKARLLESYKMVESTNEKSRTISSYSPVNDIDRYEVSEDECAMEEEKFIVPSTVDDLFMEEEKSEDELTFADIEESLGMFSPSGKRSPMLCRSSRSSWQDTSIESEPEFAFHEEEPPKMDCTRKDVLPIVKKEPKNENIAKVGATVNSSMKVWKRTSLVRNSHAASSSTLLAYRCSDSGVIEQREVSSGASLLIGNNERTKSIANEPDHTPVVLTGSPKAKRPRKQQLTSVNRGDSEIIIQPATFPNEDDEDEEDAGGFRRKRMYRRKRKQVRTSVRYKMKTSATKRRGGSRPRGDRAQPKKQYEIIEIDVDEEDRLSGSGGSKNKNIVEITLDESREKGSSDKENQVIMVGDSDDDEDDDDEDITRADSSKSRSPAVASLKCEYCSRTFRQKRAVKTHSRLCPKSPKNIKRLEERTLRSNDSSVPKKEFSCKICQEKFDVVVVLARHVKSMHSMRKKPNSSQDTSNTTAAATSATATTLNKTRKERGSKSTEQKIELDEPVTCASSSATAAAATTVRKGPRRRRRRRKRIKTNQGWKGQKLHCSDCAKWFSSAALLASHSLQHATKKSEKQIRRCQTCKKMFKSKLLYIRHMRMHSRVKTLQKKLHHTRQASVKLATLRKHGSSRPRKLRSSSALSDIYP